MKSLRQHVKLHVCYYNRLRTHQEPPGTHEKDQQHSKRNKNIRRRCSKFSSLHSSKAHLQPISVRL
eukprot:1160761-Pelagomonas_calceolata.AAC.2